jgi:hypothetical protein
VFLGISTSMFLRLCCRAPRTEILVMAIKGGAKWSFGYMDGTPEIADSGGAHLYSVS